MPFSGVNRLIGRVLRLESLFGVDVDALGLGVGWDGVRFVEVVAAIEFAERLRFNKGPGRLVEV